MCPIPNPNTTNANDRRVFPLGGKGIRSRVTVSLLYFVVHLKQPIILGNRLGIQLSFGHIRSSPKCTI